MKIKRFFAPDMSSAMRLVRDEVGPDAVILSNNSVAGGVEVVVALEYSEVVRPRLNPVSSASRKEKSVAALVGKRKPARLQSELGRTRTALASSQQNQEADQLPYLKAKKDQQLGLDDAVWDDVLASLDQKKRSVKDRVSPLPSQGGAVARKRNDSRKMPSVRRQENVDLTSAEPSAVSARSAEVSSHEQSLRQMRSEIDELKSLLQSRVSVEAAAPAPPVLAPAPAVVEGHGHGSLRNRIYKRLLRIGVVDSLAERLVQAIEADTEVDRAWKIALSRLADALPTVGENIADRGGVLAFVGATGVGKTTTIGKLAAQYVLKHGSSSVALVTTDTYRIAAHEQLRTFGRILDIPVRVVDESRSLDDALHSLRDKRLVLVDTSGLSMSSGQRQEQLDMLSSSSYRIKKYLVLPCTAQYQVLQMACEHFKSLGLNGAVLSKVDESVSLGEAISTIVEQRLPVAYLGDGQKIPDDIEVARANTIVSRAVVLAEEQARAYKNRSLTEPDGSQSPAYAHASNTG
ncbi:MAG: flagellar biosynthesis protein FlhF [Motiliproteus sp.]